MKRFIDVLNANEDCLYFLRLEVHGNGEEKGLLFPLKKGVGFRTKKTRGKTDNEINSTRSSGRLCFSI